MTTTPANNEGLAARGRLGNGKRHGACGLLAAICLACAVLPAGAGTGDFAEPLGEPSYHPVDEGWKTALEVYGWMPDIGVTAASGESVTIGIDDILDNLDMTIKAGFSAQKGRWTLGVDVIYLDMSGGENLNALTRLDLDMTNWIVTPTVGYKLLDDSRGSLTVFGGARYLYLKERIDLRIGSTSTVNSSSGSSWAAVAGVEGVINLSERWFMPYYADIGTGDPDLTWQAFLGVGYHFDSWDLIAGYRYLKWEFESGEDLKEMEVSGPMIGARFTF